MIKFNFKYIDSRLPNEEVVTYLVQKTRNFRTENPNLIYKYLRIYGLEKWQPQSSFILNPKELFKNEAGAERYEIYTYIKLCSFRSYISYLESKKSNIATALVEDCMDISKLKFNRLLTVTDSHIDFKYE
jgi:hypothetical protein